MTDADESIMEPQPSSSKTARAEGISGWYVFAALIVFGGLEVWWMCWGRRAAWERKYPVLAELRRQTEALPYNISEFAVSADDYPKIGALIAAGKLVAKTDYREADSMFGIALRLAEATRTGRIIVVQHLLAE